MVNYTKDVIDIFAKYNDIFSVCNGDFFQQSEIVQAIRKASQDLYETQQLSRLPIDGETFSGKLKFSCPFCGRTIKQETSTTMCVYCGQKLRWD